jgi:hypothetical protein
MFRVTDHVLLAYAADALDGEVRALVEEHLNGQPELRARLHALRAEVGPPTSPAGPRWSVPPSWAAPAMTGPVLQVLADTLGAAFPTGDSVEVEVHRSLEVHGDDVVVVLSREPAGWQVLFPREPASMRTLRQLPRSRQDRPILGLTITATHGRQRWAVVLVPPELTIDWSLPEVERWAEVRRALQARQLVVESFEVDVG